LYVAETYDQKKLKITNLFEIDIDRTIIIEFQENHYYAGEEITSLIFPSEFKLHY
jgi:hypothetical protein